MPIVPKGTHSIYCSTSLQKKLEAYRPLRKYCVHLRRRKESIEYESTDKSNQQDDQRVSQEG